MDNGTVMGRARPSLWLILLNMAEWQPFCLSVVLYCPVFINIFVHIRQAEPPYCICTVCNMEASLANVDENK